MSKHTPGPWTDKSTDESKWGVYCSNGDQIAQAQQLKPLREDIKQVERTANAKLIAAAPELLDILREILGKNLLAGAIKHDAKAAIAKATGE